MAPKRLAGKVTALARAIASERSVFVLPYAFIGALYGAAAARWEYVGTRAAPGGAASGAGIPLYAPPSWVTSTGMPRWSALVVIAVALVAARSFTLVVNRASDRAIGVRGPRAAGSAVPARPVVEWELWLYAVGLFVVLMFSVWQLHPDVRRLWPILLAGLLVHPYTKRFTPLCHYWLGMCLGLAPVGAWVAVGGAASDPAPWVFGAAVMVWTAGSDIIHSAQDVECYVRDGVHSMPADVGIEAALAQARVLHAMSFVLLLLAGWLVGAGGPFHVGVVVAGILLLYENYLVRADDLARVDTAFVALNGATAIVVLAGALADRLLA